MIRRAALALAVLFACAHTPEPPPGPRPLTGRSQMFRGDASAALELRYEVGSGREVRLHADLLGSGTGSVGPVTVEVAATGFEIDGAAAWTGEVAAGGRVAHTWTLRAQTDGVARLEVRHAIEGQPPGEPARASFKVTSESIVLCSTADCGGDADE